MDTSAARSQLAAAQSATDDEIVERVLRGDTALYEILVSRYNQRVYRTVRAILRDDDVAEDVMQDAYVRAFQHLGQYEHRAAFSTWLTRIAVHEAFARLRDRKRFEATDTVEFDATPTTTGSISMTPEQAAASAQTHKLLEQAVLSLPTTYRSVVVLRDVEGMSTAETAAALDLTEEAVKVRLHRARALLRRELFSRAGATGTSAFQFHATRCDRVTRRVMEVVHPA